MSVRTQVLEYSSPKIDGHRIIGVKILGAKSANGYSYPILVMQKAMPLYESAPVFVEHPGPREKKRGSRQLTDHFGTLTNIRQRQHGKGIYGDLLIKPSHPMAENVLEEAAGAARFGLSHNAIVDMDEQAGEVTQIISVNSVDLVDEPATTTTLFESKEETMTEETTTTETPPVEPDRITVLEEKIDQIIEQIQKAPAKPVRRVTALEEIPADEQDGPAVGDTHDDFMAALRGFRTT